MNEKIQKLKQLAITRYGQKQLDMRFTKNMRIRLNHELEMIENMKFADLFWSFIKFCDESKERGDYYVVGYANCSFLFYCTNTTAVNPLAFRLPFERFLNPCRICYPYFEIAFEPKFILTEQEEKMTREKLCVIRAIENKQLPADALDVKYAYWGIQGYPFVEEILKETNGVLIWQEQLLELLHRVGGFSYGEADIIRRQMAKKHQSELFGEVRPKFLQHAVQVGCDYKWADGFFHYIYEERSPYLPMKANYAALVMHTTTTESE
jgi:DNA polymerase III alpha subunit